MDETENARRVAERYASAWSADDLTSLLDCYADNFTLHYFGDNPFTGSHVGKDSALETLLAVGALAPRTLLSIEEILAGLASAVIVAVERITVGDDTHDIRRVFRYRVTGERFSECWLYEESQALIDRAWSGS